MTFEHVHYRCFIFVDEFLYVPKWSQHSQRGWDVGDDSQSSTSQDKTTRDDWNRSWQGRQVPRKVSVPAAQLSQSRFRVRWSLVVNCLIHHSPFQQLPSTKAKCWQSALEGYIARHRPIAPFFNHLALMLVPHTKLRWFISGWTGGFMLDISIVRQVYTNQLVDGWPSCS